MANRFVPVRVNLVEQKGWEPWDSAATLSERASDAAHEEFRYMPLETVQDLLSDMAGDNLKGRSGPKEWSPRKMTLSDDDLKWLARQVTEGRQGDEPFLDETRFAILDAITWMYEEAMTPSDGDIRDAIYRMIDYSGSHYYDMLDEELWEPLIGDHSSIDSIPTGAIAEDLAKNVEYQREQNYYDRYLVFNLGESELAQKLLSKGGRAWWPKKKVVSRLETEFRKFREWYLEHFWDALHKEFDDIQIENRTNWKKHWKSMLSMTSQMDVARKEMLEAIREKGASDA